MQRRRRLLLILWVFIIFVLSLIPTAEAPKLQIIGMDKVLHFSAYLILGMIAQSCIGFHSITLGIVLGTVTELLQRLIPGRTVEIFDWTANVLGLGIGIGAFFLVRKVL